MFIIIIGCLFWFIQDTLLFYLTSVICAKKCGYDCSKCKDWHCNAHYCNEKRNKLLKNKESGENKKRGELIND